MKFEKLKYILMICIALALFFKVSSALSYLAFSKADVEHSLLNDDATEKEERKVETEYFAHSFLTFESAFYSPETSKKVVVPSHLSQLNYFPEVLTPPPSV
ncbi:hypothetical protein [Pedobacter endophyticus]|uniref:Uncharacterized protein n=1 Tax=Pedobacter endophyticus TaxID=2789740 RepID=A0A7S9L359_9SPHI|nr:hypothetical protein [Pedobacter endophyticus]QPH41639.1 hypothetical protein IZT61_10460 [Pedobacter endophyticus]